MHIINNLPNGGEELADRLINDLTREQEQGVSQNRTKVRIFHYNLFNKKIGTVHCDFRDTRMGFAKRKYFSNTTLYSTNDMNYNITFLSHANLY